MWNKIDSNLISGCYELVFDESKIGADDSVFRMKHLETFIIVREDLLEKIQNVGFSGIDMTPIDEFEC